MIHVNTINNVRHVSECCEFPIWRTTSFPIVRKKLIEIGTDSALNLGVCETCESFFLIDRFEQPERNK
tara:strand:- start:1862 stop:2065 length:204 start_codon:yes stop_codon:yes gene_type:complete